MIEFRRRMDSDTLHWRRDCPDWPILSYFSFYAEETVREKCGKCKELEKEGDCGN